jgi:hypothetical protein
MDRSIHTKTQGKARVFISYKHGAHDPHQVRAIATLLNNDEDLEAWFDELSDGGLQKNPVNVLLKRLFPDVLSLLVGLGAFLQHKLEDSDAIVFIIPAAPSPDGTKKSIFKRQEIKGLWHWITYNVQLNLLFWVMMIALILVGHLYIFWGIGFCLNTIQHELTPILFSLKAFLVSPWKKLKDGLTRKPAQRPSFLSELTRRDTKLENNFGYLFLPTRYVRNALIYRAVYGIKMPRVLPLFSYNAKKSWQEWELEAATALGLNVVKVALLEDKADQSQMSEDTVTLYVDHLDHDLAQEVLPRLRRKYRKPLQVQRGFLKILIAVLSVLFLLLVMLVSIIAIVVYLIVSWFIHLVAGIL